MFGIFRESKKEVEQQMNKKKKDISYNELEYKNKGLHTGIHILLDISCVEELHNRMKWLKR